MVDAGDSPTEGTVKLLTMAIALSDQELKNRRTPTE